MKPRRLQRSRKKGWRKPRGVVIVDRTSRWGNPFLVSTMVRELGARRQSRSTAGLEAAARRLCVEAFKCALLGGRLPFSVADVERELRGKDLACWCPAEQACHADVLLQVANGDRARRVAVARETEYAAGGTHDS